MSNRRNFIKATTVGATVATFYPIISHGEKLLFNDPPTSGTLPIGIADYTFLHFDIPQSIQMMQRLDIHLMSIKDFHLPMDSSQEKIDEVLKQYRDGGITIYGVGVIYMKTKDAVDQAFEYAKKAGALIIIGVPDHDLIDYAEEKVKAYNIKLAIHNHGPEDKLYPSPEDVYRAYKKQGFKNGALPRYRPCPPCRS